MLLDGLGREAVGEVTAARKSQVRVRLISVEDVNREPQLRLTLAVSLPKGDRQKLLIEKLTELGVSRLIPLRSQRSVAQPSDSALERLEQHVIGACKQSGRTRKLEIVEPLDVGQLAKLERPAVRLVAHPTGLPGFAFDTLPKDELLVAIGPEGGFTDEEVACLAAAGWLPLQLGPRVLRIETAAIGIAARLLL